MPPTADELQAQLDTAEQEKAELQKRVDELEKAEPENEGSKKKAPSTGDDHDADDSGDAGESKKSEIDKSALAPEVRAALDKAEADVAAAAARAAEAETIAKHERDQRLDREFLAKAEGYKFLGAETQPLATMLKSASALLPSDQYEALEGVLKAADEQVRQGALFEQMGSDQAEGGPTDALNEVARKAEELKKSDSTLSLEKAMEQVMANDRELQQRYLTEVR